MDWKKGIRQQPDLKIDCDTHRHNPIQRFNFRAKYLIKYFPALAPMKVVVYKTKKGFHFYVYAANMDFRSLNGGIIYTHASRYLKILFQSILGSDWLRELRNLNRVEKGDQNWNILFSEKDKNGKMQYEKFYCAYVLKRR
jgi:hypothetical protein